MFRDELRVCTKCKIHHYENCNFCFGFGVYSVEDKPGELFPVAAYEAHGGKGFRGKVQTCPECGSTVNGIPNKEI